MKKKKLFKFLSMLSLVLFYFFTLTGLFVLFAEYMVTMKPESAFSKSFGGFEPIYSSITVNFHKQPNIYQDPSFLWMNLVSVFMTFLFVTLLFWFLHKMLKNIHNDNLFMYENATLIFSLGIMFLVVGTLSGFINERLTSEAIRYLQITNAELEYTSVEYFDFLIIGIVLMLIGASLKKAVQAVEENNETI